MVRGNGQILSNGQTSLENEVERSELGMKRELWNQGLMYLLVGLFVFCVVPFLRVAV